VLALSTAETKYALLVAALVLSAPGDV
jgi:hypothetical protein